MTNSEVDAIVGGYHGDPFRVLGPHPCKPAKKGVNGGWQVNAFLPQAESVDLLLGPKVVPMRKKHPAGFFAAQTLDNPGAYRLRLKLWSGGSLEIDDPYRFPQL